MMAEVAVYAGPEGQVFAVDGGYAALDDSGWLEGTFRSLADAYASIGATPVEYPIAEGDVTREPDVEPEPLHPHLACGGMFTEADLAAHIDPASPGRVKCQVMFGPAADLSDVAAAARARREAQA